MRRDFRVVTGTPDQLDNQEQISVRRQRGGVAII